MVKIERSLLAPPSLAIEAKKANGSCTQQDVIDQLKHDFHNKCYICELSDLSDPNVEHLLPHKNGRYPERKFDWNNLFWSCPHCNNIKSQSKYDEGILDCCKVDPETLIDFQWEHKGIRLTSTSEDITVKRTMELVWEVFNLKNTGMRVHASSFRMEKLCMEMNLLFAQLHKLETDPTRSQLNRVRILLRKESEFAAFKRCYVRMHLSRYPQLEPFLC